jgi:hypothetical protein
MKVQKIGTGKKNITATLIKKHSLKSKTNIEKRSIHQSYQRFHHDRTYIIIIIFITKCNVASSIDVPSSNHVECTNGVNDIGTSPLREQSNGNGDG